MNKYIRAIQKNVHDPKRMVIFSESIANRYQFTKLYRIRIESASACNLRCRYCPTGTDYDNSRVTRQVMPDAVFDRIVNQIKELPTVNAATTYLGGEPLINKALLANIRRLLDDTTIRSIELVTNGMLLTEDFCRQLGAIENFESFLVQISLDGRRPEDNDFARRGADYQAIKNNIIMLRKILPARFDVQIANVQVPTLDEAYCTPVPPAYLQADFGELLKQTFGPFIIDSHWAQIWPGLDEAYLAAEGYRKKALLNPVVCAYPLYEVSVRANGDVVPCCYDLKSEQIMGNICDENLRDILDSPAYRQLREALVHYYAFGETRSLPPLCRRCVLITSEVLHK